MNTNVNSDKILLKKAINMGASSKTIILSQLKDRKTSQASLYLNHFDSTSLIYSYGTSLLSIVASLII
jgi:hypothetical protein